MIKMYSDSNTHSLADVEREMASKKNSHLMQIERRENTKLQISQTQKQQTTTKKEEKKTKTRTIVFLAFNRKGKRKERT